MTKKQIEELKEDVETFKGLYAKALAEIRRLNKKLKRKHNP
jgi:hypothetical protein